MGDDYPFYTARGGNAVFSYDDTIYYVKTTIMFQTKHIIYVEDNTTDVLEAIKTRLTKIFGTDFNIKETDTVANFLENEKNRAKEFYAQEISRCQGQGYTSAEEYANAKMNKTYYNEDAEYSFVTDSNIYEKYYYFVNANNEDEYNDFVNNAKNVSLYDTGITANYGDQLLTLSTCEYSQEDGRFVVVCKKIGDVQ